MQQVNASAHITRFFILIRAIVQAFRGLINVFSQKFRHLQICSQEYLQKFHQLKAVGGLDLPQDFDKAPLRLLELRIELKTSFLNALQSLHRVSRSKSRPPRKSEFTTMRVSACFPRHRCRH